MADAASRPFLPPDDDDDLVPEIEIVADPPPRRLGRYTLERLLGTGGWSRVYLARAHGPAGFDKRVALKLLHPLLSADAGAVMQFVAEARLAAQLTHPSIVQTLDLGVGAECYIVMEHVDGADLSRLLELCRRLRRVPPPAIALTIVRRVCDALHAVHTARGDDGAPLGIVHRDVKPANVLVTRHGAVKLGDFGIACVRAGAGPRLTAAGQAKGTPEYMAPEQRRGGPVDARVDVYGAGAIAYQLLSGRRINLDVTRLRPLGADGWPHLPPLRALAPSLPPALDEIVRYALAYAPEARFSGCAALGHALGIVAARHDLCASDDELAAWVAPLLALAPADLPPAAQPPLPELPAPGVGDAPTLAADADAPATHRDPMLEVR